MTRLEIMRNRVLPLLAVVLFALLLVWVVLAPSESRLGNLVKLVFVHGALVWSGLLAFTIAGALGLVSLVVAAHRGFPSARCQEACPGPVSRNRVGGPGSPDRLDRLRDLVYGGDRSDLGADHCLERAPGAGHRIDSIGGAGAVHRGAVGGERAISRRLSACSWALCPGSWSSRRASSATRSIR